MNDTWSPVKIQLHVAKCCPKGRTAFSGHYLFISFFNSDKGVYKVIISVYMITIQISVYI
jgi:hypothetical protein